MKKFKEQVQEREIIAMADRKGVIKDFKAAFDGIDLRDLSVSDIAKMIQKEIGLDKKEAMVIAKGLVQK